jgi:hypothetical protein
MKLRNNGYNAVGFYIPTWATQAVSTILIEWAGTADLTDTLTTTAFWYFNNGRDLLAAANQTITFTNYFNTLTFTNAWPETNTVKSMRLFQDNAQTNTSSNLRLVRWNVTYNGVPEVGKE